MTLARSNNSLTHKAGRRLRKSGFIGALVTLPLLLQGCVTTNPATGQSDFTPFMSPDKETAIGKEQHPLILKQHGGVVDNPQVAGYVAVTGGRLAAVSEMPKTPFTFTVLNSPIVNAFALPGGYIYVTRGILGLFNSESEMASVLGHEIGHVTGRHSAKRYNQQILTGLGATLLGAVLKSNELSDMVGYGSQLYLKSYSRGNEYEADKLGVRYSTRAGFDPYAAADMLRSLDAQSQLEDAIANRTGQQRPPEFFSTHPNTKDRVTRAHAAARETGLPENSRDRGRDRFLDAINGMTYGDDPAQGVITGRTFSHGPARFSFTVPENYRLLNSSDAVYAQGTGPAEGGVVIFAGDRLKGRNMIEFTSQTWKGLVKDAPLEGLQDFTLNGMEAITGWHTMQVAKVNSQVRIVTVRHSADQAYFFLMVTPLTKLDQQREALQRMTYSFKKLSPTEARDVRGRIIRVVTVKRGDTAQSLARKMAFSDHQLDRFLVLNGLNSPQSLRAGQRVKLVVYGQ
ncbi:M48 family metalloprotease [Paremcibacter congregatus]|uniref:Peptidase M48 n=1 Tax=Paremcibacter congregatus TaxID=2043170 RepID=A0A2G4YVY3_9PROT|nr:M48 family metalloprotease [Paremcibacter congregatus]PHZ86488.1 peptidase M48 [Paremcibacter congregatus]QDE28417.1 LysM peptidoglycan-binding domain-containing protein [Paremcibacter congregatus]